MFQSRPHKWFCRHSAVWGYRPLLASLKAKTHTHNDMHTDMHPHTHYIHITIGLILHKHFLFLTKSILFVALWILTNISSRWTFVGLHNTVIDEEEACPRLSTICLSVDLTSCLLLSLCRDLKVNKVWQALLVLMALLWVTHASILRYSVKLPIDKTIKWWTTKTLGLLLQGHPGKEGPPGEKGAAVSRT